MSGRLQNKIMLPSGNKLIKKAASTCSVYVSKCKLFLGVNEYVNSWPGVPPSVKYRFSHTVPITDSRAIVTLTRHVREVY